MIRGVLFAIVVMIASSSAAMELSGNFIQGGLVIGYVSPGSRVTVDGEPVRVSERGAFLIGFGRDAKGPTTVAVSAPDGTMERRQLPVAMRDWNIQRIDGLPAIQVTPNSEALARIRVEAALIRAIRGIDSPESGFNGGFIWPVIGPTSGVFGSQRILNGEPRSPHNGVDIAAPPGTFIRAAAGGTVALAHPDMFFTGQSLMIDHGHGLTSVYVHMSEMLVSEGQSVKKGDPIGRVGATGRVTGPHLHWGVALFLTHLDPALLAGPMPGHLATE